jgi:c-di-GMP phosphodiesterase
MQSFNTSYSNCYQLSKYIHDHKINRQGNVLVQIFTSNTDAVFAKILVKEIKENLPQAQIIGTTTAGEILDCQINIGTTVLSFSIFEKTRVKSALLEKAPYDFALGQHLANSLVSANTKLLLVFGNPLAINGSDMLTGIGSVGNHFKVAGGHAGDNGYLDRTFVFNDQSITDRGIVGVALDSTGLEVFNAYSLCWQGIGKTMTVTKASKDKIFEVDHMKIHDIYQKYLGDKVANSLPESATEFP